MSPPWMPFNVSDYLSDTAHLTTLEHGAYLLLIMHYWREGCLPEDERLVARIAKMTAEQWEESVDVLAMFFHDGWKHNRIDEELRKAKEIIEKRKAAAEAQHAKRKSGASAEQVHGTCSDASVPPKPLPEDTSSLRSDVSARETKRTPLSELRKVLDEEHAAAVIEHRCSLRKPLTAHAAKLLAGKLAKHSDANFAADAMIANGWQGFELGWLANRGTGPPKQGMSARMAALCDQPVETTVDEFTRSLQHQPISRVG